MGSDLTGLVAAVRDSISACVIHILLVDCNRKQVKHLCMCVDDVRRMLFFIYFSFFKTEPYWASAGGCWGAREGHHFLDGQAELEPMQRVADANLPLNLCVWQIGHDCAALYVGTACGHVPRRHPDPQLWTEKLVNYRSAPLAMLRFDSKTHLEPCHNSWAIPWCKRKALTTRFL